MPLTDEVPLNQSNYQSYPIPPRSPIDQFVPPPPIMRNSLRPVGSVTVANPSVARFRNDIRFDGTSSKLKTFFQDFYGEIRNNEAFFAGRDDKYKINWLATLFSPGSAVKNWFLSLLEQNAERQGRFDGYDDLQALDYKLEPLQSLPQFLRELRVNFADKNEDRTNRKNLDNCVQGSSSIIDYNSRFRSLVLHVSISPEDAIIKYVNGLDRDVHHEAIRLPGWVNCILLQDKMNLAVTASEIVRELSELPHNHPGFLKKKFKTDLEPQKVIPIPILAPRKVDQAVPMDIDTIHLKKAKSIFVSIINAARDRGLCAKCFEKYDLAGSHAKGVCPNRNKTLGEKIKFFNIKQVSKIEVKETQEEFNVNSIAFANISEDQSSAVFDFMGEYFAAMNDIQYPDMIQEEVLDINSIRIEASSLANGKFLVPFTLLVGEAPIAVMALIDTGSMANLISQELINTHNIPVLDRPPMRCFGFDGSAGTSGVIDKRWCGDLVAIASDSSKIRLSADLGVTRIHGQDIILGLPWMQSSKASAICHESGFYLAIDGVAVTAITLAPLSVISCESSLVDSISVSVFSTTATETSSKGIVENPSTIMSHEENLRRNDSPNPSTTPLSETPEKSLPINLPKSCRKYSHVFFPQDFVLPPHRLFDCAIDLKPDCDPPFGGLYNLAQSEQTELREYLNEMLEKGFIRPSSSAAAAPIFFVKVPGKKNRPCVDY